MFATQLRYLLSRDAFSSLVNNFLVGFGTIWLIIESFSFFLAEALSYNKTNLFWFTIFVASAWAVWRSFPKQFYSLRFRKTNVEIQIKVGNILDEDSNIAIGINNRFTTNASRKIGGRSIRAQLAFKLYNGETGLLDQAIVDSLGGNTSLIDPNEGLHLATLGQIGVIETSGGNKVFFVINQESQTGGVQTTARDQLWVSLCNLWDVVKDNGYNHPISVPVLGSGLGRAPASRTSLIQLILLSFAVANREVAITERLTIVIRETDYNPEEMNEAISFIKNLDL